MNNADFTGKERDSETGNTPNNGNRTQIEIGRKDPGGTAATFTQMYGGDKDSAGNNGATVAV